MEDNSLLKPYLEMDIQSTAVQSKDIEDPSLVLNQTDISEDSATKSDSEISKIESDEVSGQKTDHYDEISETTQDISSGVEDQGVHKNSEAENTNTLESLQEQTNYEALTPEKVEEARTEDSTTNDTESTENKKQLNKTDNHNVCLREKNRNP